MLTLTLQTLAGATRVGSNLGLFGQMHVLFACRLVMLNGSLTVEVFSPVHCGGGINESNASGIRQPFATGTEKKAGIEIDAAVQGTGHRMLRNSRAAVGSRHPARSPEPWVPDGCCSLLLGTEGGVKDQGERALSMCKNASSDVPDMQRFGDGGSAVWHQGASE